jgi:hypothetical protein
MNQRVTFQWQELKEEAAAPNTKLQLGVKIPLFGSQTQSNLNKYWPVWSLELTMNIHESLGFPKLFL